MLTYPRPTAFVQALRMRRRALSRDTPLVVVEGSSDKRALTPFLASDVRLLAARGKEQVVLAFQTLEAPLRDSVLFIIDCDGEVSQELKGHPELILTTNRDIEADLLFELNAMSRVCDEFLVPAEAGPGTSPPRSQLLDDAAILAMRIGALRASAIAASMRMRITDPATGRRRKISVADLDSVIAPALHSSLPSLREIAHGMAQVIGWTATETATALAAAERRLAEDCKSHATENCFHCLRRRYCNGHHLVEAVTFLLHARHEARVAPEAMPSFIRLSADREQVGSWDLANRVRRWERTTGLQVLQG